MTRVALESLGCKLNQAETESLAWQFVKRGYELAESAAEADVYVLNTCTVTHVADRKTRHLLRSVCVALTRGRSSWPPAATRSVPPKN